MIQRSRTSVKEVINLLLQDKEYSKNFNEIDTINRIGHCTSLLKGGVETYLECCVIPVKDYIAPYPEDCVRLVTLFFNGEILSTDKSADSSQMIRYDNRITNEYLEFAKLLTVRENILNSNIEEPDRSKIVDEITYYADFITKSSRVSKCFWYEPKTHCILTNIESGNLIVKYRKILKDENGYPYIYDEGNYKETLKYYCLWQDCLNNRDFRAAQQFEALYIRYKGKAENEIRAMNKEQYIEFADNWSNLIYQMRDNVNIFKNY